MAEDEDRDLPLHDEAEARSKWRGGETIIGEGGGGDSGPASEVDDGGQGGAGTAESSLLDDLAKRPPD
ncbi:MAG TPA: hypothetical protein VK403_11225 [Allosphingosinicella sp.]|nr:hypothetical protein [Allosphingosinicella sp.]